MSTFEFTCNRQPTVGIELELALVDQESWQLASQVGDVLARLDPESAVSFKPELVQCCVEINTGVCSTIADAKQDLEGKLLKLQSLVEPLNLSLWWGATHPFSLWRDQHITPDERYQKLVELLQEMARSQA